MVEFGHALRVYYLYQPDKYDTAVLITAYRHLGLLTNSSSTTKIDAVIWNYANERPERLPPAEITIEHNAAFEKLAILQKKHAGHCFGANNPWIVKPPDKLHAGNAR